MISQPGVAVLITDKVKENFLLQKKDNSHPILACRGCFSLFGGSKEPGEEHIATLERELHEEWNADELVELVLANVYYWQSFYLKGNQYSYDYDLYVFIAELEENIWQKIREKIGEKGVVCEGFPVFVDRKTLLEFLKDTNLFVASIDQAISAYLDKI